MYKTRNLTFQTQDSKTRKHHSRSEGYSPVPNAGDTTEESHRRVADLNASELSSLKYEVSDFHLNDNKYGKVAVQSVTR